MRRWRRQRLIALIGIFAIAALLCLGLAPRLIAAQDATPPATQEQDVTAISESDGAADTATIDSGDTAETPVTTDDGNDASGDADDETPAPSDGPAPSIDPPPSDQPVPPPAVDASGGAEGDQPSPSPSAAPRPSPSPSPSPSSTAQVWENHDTLSLTGADPASGTPLQPAATATLQFVYTVTTPRIGTTIHAELRPVSGDASGWQVRLSSLDGAGDDWRAAGPIAATTESATTQLNSTFTLTIAIHAPPSITAPTTVALVVSSTATIPDGSAETGLSGAAPTAQLQAEPSPSPLAATPTTLSTPEAASTASAGTCSADVTTLPEVTASTSSFPTLSWSGTSYTSVNATIEVTLSLPLGRACLAPTWSVTLRTSAMTSDGDDTQPAATISFHGVSGLAAPSLRDAGLPLGTTLGQAETVVTGTNQTLDATRPTTTFQITVTWSPPAGTPAGHDTSDVSVASVAGTAP